MKRPTTLLACLALLIALGAPGPAFAQQQPSAQPKKARVTAQSGKTGAKAGTKAGAKKGAPAPETAPATAQTTGGAGAPTTAPQTGAPGATNQATGVTTPPAGSSPMAELKRSNAQLDKLLGKRTASWSPERDLQRAEVKKLVGSFLDFEELGRRALARHWDGLTPAQRQEFVGLLRELVERSYLKQVHGKPNYRIAYDDETVQGSEAQVNATLHTTARGKKVTVDLVYKLLYKNGSWLVYDVITDEQSLLETYRAEFNKIITKESFSALLDRMRKKLEQNQQNE